MRRLCLAALLVAATTARAEELTRDDTWQPFPARLLRHSELARAAEARGDEALASRQLAIVCHYVHFIRLVDDPSCDRALTLARKLHRADLEAGALSYSANWDLWTNDFARADEKEDQALRLLDGAELPFIAAGIHLVRGNVAIEKGDYDRALAELARTRDLSERDGDPDFLARAHIFIGRAYGRLGDAESARPEVLRGLALGRDIGDLVIQREAEWISSLVEETAGHYDLAVAHSREAFRLAMLLQIPIAMASMRNNTAELLMEAGRYDEAEIWIAASSADMDSGRAPPLWRAFLDNERASIAGARGDHRRAAELNAASAAQARQYTLRLSALLGRARELVLAGELDAAHEAYGRVIDEVESGRDRAPAEMQRANYLAANSDPYRELVLLLWRLRGAAGAEEAFLVAERGRARSLLDALAASGQEGRVAAPLGAAATRALLGPRQILLEYVAAPDALVGFAVTADGVRWSALPAAAASRLGERIDYFQKLVQEADGPAELRPAAQRLYAELVAPLLEGAGAMDTIIVSPDGPLHGLPFDALVGPDGRFLVEGATLLQTPSASLLTAPPARPSGVGVLIVADPPQPEGLPLLPASREEARRVLAAAGAGDLLAGADATEARVKQAIGGHAVLHFATHTVVDEVLPLRSALVLAAHGGDDGYLRAAEIYHLQLRADLVVLSSCRSGTGRLAGGEGVMSLARAFRHGGARAVVSTLWQIGDRSTVGLMSAFYQELAAGRPIADALARAKRTSFARGAPPRSWAAFIVAGRPAASVELPGAPDTGARPRPSLAYPAVLLAFAALSFAAARRV